MSLTSSLYPKGDDACATPTAYTSERGRASTSVVLTRWGWSVPVLLYPPVIFPTCL